MQTLKNEATGLSSFIPDRESEVRRLRCKWGNSFNVPEDTIVAPTVEIHTLDGERIFTVVEDPKGQHSMPATTDTYSLSLENQIASMQKQLDSLLKMQEFGETPTPTDEPPSDDTTAPRRGLRPSAKSAADD